MSQQRTTRQYFSKFTLFLLNVGRSIALLTFVFGFGMGTGQSDAELCEWLPEVNGNWDVDSNWSCMHVPGSDDDVVIDVPNATVTVTINNTLVSDIKSLMSEENLELTEGGAGLRILGEVGHINGGLTLNDATVNMHATTLAVDGGLFQATGPTTLENAILRADSGGELLLQSAVSYSNASGQTFPGIGQVVATAGGTVDMRNVTTFEGNTWQNTNHTQVWADDGGTVDLRSVATLSEGRIEFKSTDGSTLDLSGLGSVETRIRMFVGAQSMINVGSLELMSPITMGYAPPHVTGNRGTISGTVVNTAGCLSAGPEMQNGCTTSGTEIGGILTISGDYNQGTEGEFKVAIRGIVPGDDPDEGYSQVQVGGDANLSGVLELFTNFYAPSNGDTFEILRTDGIVTGEFDTLVADDPNLWVIDYTDNAVILRVVPEPSAWFIGMLGLWGMLFASRVGVA